MAGIRDHSIMLEDGALAQMVFMERGMRGG